MLSDDVAAFIQALHPPLSPDGFGLVGEVVLAREHQGNPGCVHGGGFLAFLLDHVVVCTATHHVGLGVVTGRHNVRYRAAVPVVNGKIGPPLVEAESILAA